MLGIGHKLHGLRLAVNGRIKPDHIEHGFHIRVACHILHGKHRFGSPPGGFHFHRRHPDCLKDRKDPGGVGICVGQHKRHRAVDDIEVFVGNKGVVFECRFDFPDFHGAVHRFNVKLQFFAAHGRERLVFKGLRGHPELFKSGENLPGRESLGHSHRHHAVHDVAGEFLNIGVSFKGLFDFAGFHRAVHCLDLKFHRTSGGCRSDLINDVGRHIEFLKGGEHRVRCEG